MYDIQDLYTAVMILGRARTEVFETGWVCATIGSVNGAKCINGVVSVAAAPAESLRMVDDLPYIHELPDLFPELARPLLLASRALVTTIPGDVATQVAGRAVGDKKTIANPDDASLHMLGEVLVSVNDITDDLGYRLMNKARVIQWIEAAQNLLAQLLPDPIPATSTATATRELVI